MEMREVFIGELSKMMEKDEKIVLLDADLSNCIKSGPIHKAFPDRAFNVGIAEQNMVSIAAGLSSYGFKPFVSSFSPFATRRVCDQITLSCLYSKQNVKIVGTDPGISAEINGGTHMGMEDIGTLRSIADIVIFEPVDEVQLKAAMPSIVSYDGTMYIRLFRKTLDKVFDENTYKFDLFKADVVQEGKDITVCCSGIMVQETMKANEILKKEGISLEIINVHTIKPIDGKTIVESAKKTGAVLTCENHEIIGGLYSAVSEVLSKECPTKMDAIGVPNCFGEVGKMPYLKEIYKMRAEDIVAKVKKMIKK
ncbi:MAG: transketolase C-terminal domain-containing protein [Eubacteriales bacterium]|nr:transketolase C-terminal domain-containing protein [Eubacteriales bacterium]